MPRGARIVCAAVLVALTASIPASAADDIRSVTLGPVEVSITLARDSLVFGGCQIVGAELRNTSDRPLGFVYGVVTVIRDGTSIGSAGLNFYPTQPGGRSTPSALHGAQLSRTTKCGDLQLRYDIN